MAAITGNTGSIVGPTGVTNLLLNAHEWSADWELDMADCSDFAGGEWEKCAPTLQKLVGRASGWCDTSQVPVVATFESDAVSFVMTASTGRTYTFTGGYGNFQVTGKVGEMVSWTCGFESSGVVTTA